jgi:capsular polysaccharide biosynthesis protein
MMEPEFSPLHTYVSIRRRWWLVVILTLVGGLLAWGYHLLRPPLYEANATLVALLDFSRPEVIIGDDAQHYQEDSILLAAQNLILSTETLSSVLGEVERRELPVRQLRPGHEIFLERKQSMFELRVRNADPDVAAQVANLWAEKALAALEDAHAHAVNARALSDYLAAMGGCPLPPSVEPSPPSICGNASSSQIQQALASIQAQQEAETRASRGIIPGLLFTWSQEASSSDTPVAYNTPLLILVGTLLGFLVGVMVTLWPL